MNEMEADVPRLVMTSLVRRGQTIPGNGQYSCQGGIFNRIVKFVGTHLSSSAEILPFPFLSKTANASRISCSSSIPSTCFVTNEQKDGVRFCCCVRPDRAGV
jgi:hypothetical protein